ncbi:MAG: integrase [Magnetococcales bacterium]|nr:integrase [Magnetococcales bacterium]MBF0437606.1 integrase [Magnetococcales bacterium]
MGDFPQTIQEKNQLDPQVKAFAQAPALTDATRAAYWGDLRRFMDWGGAIPAPEKMVASYLVEHANSHKFATLARWRVSLGKAHSAQGLVDPTKTELVNTVLKGIKQKHGREQRRVAPLTSLQTTAVVNVMGDRLKDLRDKALILVGFSGGLRRSELTGLLVENLRERTGGMELSLNTGRLIMIPNGPDLICPVAAMKSWLSASGIEKGAVFQGINRHGRLSGQPLTGHGVALVIKERVKAVGLDPSRYSGCSPRVGGILEGAQDEAGELSTGHQMPLSKAASSHQ